MQKKTSVFGRTKSKAVDGRVIEWEVPIIWRSRQLLKPGGPQRPGKITGFCSKCNEKPLKAFKEGTGKWFTCIKDHPGCCVAGAIRGRHERRDCWEGLV